MLLSVRTDFHGNVDADLSKVEGLQMKTLPIMFDAVLKLFPEPHFWITFTNKNS